MGSRPEIDQEQLHLMIVPYSAQGHLIPALMLAHRLVNLGYQVTYVCPEYRLQLMIKHARSRACNPAINFQTLKKTVPSNGEHESNTGHDSIQLVSWTFRRREGEDAAELKELISSFDSPPLCIITDNLLAHWTQDVADELNIPRLVLFPSAALALTFEFYVRDLFQSGKIPVKKSSSPVFCIPGLESIPLKSDELGGLVQEEFPKELRDFYIDNAVRIHDSAGVMCNTFPRIEAEACSVLKENSQLNPNQVPFLEIGPLLPDSYFEEDEELKASGADREDCLKWLDEQPERSVIFVSFGSFAKASREQVDELACGLEASGKGFLWVLYDQGEDDRELMKGFQQRTEKTGMVMNSWAPQLQILSHKSVGGFLTHCGWNSTMESISRGVPMITMPFYGEQKGNARIIVERLGNGVGLAKDENGLIRRDVFENAVREVIDHGEPLRRKAAELKEAARNAMKESPVKIKSFIDKVILNYRK